MSNNKAINKVANHYRRTCRLSWPDYQDLKSHLQAKMLQIQNPAEKNAKQIYTILKHKACDWLRKHIHHTKGVSSLDVLLDAGFEPTAKASDIDTAILVGELMNRLTPKERLVLELRFGLLGQEPIASLPLLAAQASVSPVVAQRLYSSALNRLRIIAGVTEQSPASCCR